MLSPSGEVSLHRDAGPAGRQPAAECLAITIGSSERLRPSYPRRARASSEAVSCGRRTPLVGAPMSGGFNGYPALAARRSSSESNNITSPGGSVATTVLRPLALA